MKEHEEEFERWFHRLLNKMETCNIRDVIRGSKVTLKEEYIKMCEKQDKRDEENVQDTK